MWRCFLFVANDANLAFNDNLEEHQIATLHIAAVWLCAVAWVVWKDETENAFLRWHKK